MVDLKSYLEQGYEIQTVVNPRYVYWSGSLIKREYSPTGTTIEYYVDPASKKIIIAEFPTAQNQYSYIEMQRTAGQLAKQAVEQAKAQGLKITDIKPEFNYETGEVKVNVSVAKPLTIQIPQTQIKTETITSKETPLSQNLRITNIAGKQDVLIGGFGYQQTYIKVDEATKYLGATQFIPIWGDIARGLINIRQAVSGQEVYDVYKTTIYYGTQTRLNPELEQGYIVKGVIQNLTPEERITKAITGAFEIGASALAIKGIWEGVTASIKQSQMISQMQKADVLIAEKTVSKIATPQNVGETAYSRILLGQKVGEVEVPVGKITEMKYLQTEGAKLGILKHFEVRELPQKSIELQIGKHPLGEFESKAMIEVKARTLTENTLGRAGTELQKELIIFEKKPEIGFQMIRPEREAPYVIPPSLINTGSATQLAQTTQQTVKIPLFQVLGEHVTLTKALNQLTQTTQTSLTKSITAISLPKLETEQKQLISLPQTEQKIKPLSIEMKKSEVINIPQFKEIEISKSIDKSLKLTPMPIKLEKPMNFETIKPKEIQIQMQNQIQTPQPIETTITTQTPSITQVPQIKVPTPSVPKTPSLFNLPKLPSFDEKTLSKSMPKIEVPNFFKNLYKPSLFATELNIRMPRLDKITKEIIRPIL